MLWPCPRILPSLDTRQAPMGIPPSAAPALPSSSAATKPASVSDMAALFFKKNFIPCNGKLEEAVGERRGGGGNASRRFGFVMGCWRGGDKMAEIEGKKK